MPTACPKRSRKIDQDCRLQKYLALCGLGSRRACESLIAAGRVSVDGQVVKRQGTSVDAESAVVLVDGDPVSPQKKIYVLLNKPKDVISTCSDPKNRKTFLELLPDFGVRLYPVGRLDRNSEGALLVTNDGSLAQTLMHPSHGVEKVYMIWIEGELLSRQMSEMKRGIRCDGETLRVVRISPLAEKKNKSCYEIVLREGKKRQIRRALSHFGFDVRRLQRVAIGPLRLGRLKLGGWRYLTLREVALLCAVAGKTQESRRR